MAVQGRGTAPRHGGRGPGDAVLVRIHDLAGRPRGTGIVADHHGTVLTSHEAVDGLARLVLRAGDRSCVVPAEAVTPLPERDLALVPAEGLGVEPLPITVRDRVETGAYVRIAAGCWREARVLGAATGVTYTATDRFRQLDHVLELAIGTAGRDALRLGGGAAGGPVVDAGTGAVVAVLGTALHTGHRDCGFAVPLRPAQSGPLAELLARNAATVPAYGADLNLAGVLALTAASVRQDGPQGHVGREGAVAPVERAAVVREFAAFTEGPANVLGLVGPPGSGRTTELAALAARRDQGAEPTPTLWLRGADLRDEDGSVADAARRALSRAARIVAAAGGGALLEGASPGGAGTLVGVGTLGGAGTGDTGPERLAGLARAAGRPLLLLLDNPEEMPPALARRLSEWTDGTVRWLRETGARLVVACRAEYWERAGAEYPAECLYPGVGQPGDLPPCVPLGDLDEDEARRARARYDLPEGVLAAPDARHPLTLRLLSEVLAAAPDARPVAPLDRHDVLAAHLDLMCLRVAVRLAAENGLRGTAVRRLAAKVAGQVHEAARRSLGPGQGELDRDVFKALFPWGPAPVRLGGGTGWAPAVLAEGLLVPAGTGYRFAHEELADWLQGTHLDLDEALRALVHHRPAPDAEQPDPLPHHRIGPVVQALLQLARQHGTHRLSVRLEELVHALDADPHSWWAARLLGETLRRVPDATPYLRVLRLLADAIVDRRRQGLAVPGEFGPGFWTEPALPGAERLDLLRRLVLADSGPADGGRYLDAAARLLAADPTAVQPHLTRWFDDERPLPAAPHATVATAAQALLHTHRRRALDDLTEALVDSAHRRGDELLGVLAEEEPSAVCRAVDRWAHDERSARRAAAVTYGLRAMPHARSEADRELLRYAALALLARPADGGLHGGALGLLVRDPRTRARYLPRAVEHFAAGDPQLPASALVTALATHPEPVLGAFRARLHRPDAEEALFTLADAATPALARRVADLVRDAVTPCPERAAPVAAYVDRRLDTGPAARTVLFPLVTGLLNGGPEQLRVALSTVVGAPGTPVSRALRRELCDFLLVHEHAPPVLESLLRTAARHGGDELRALVHRTGMLLVRTPAGATRFDRTLLDLGREVPGFAARVAHWLNDAPQDWAAVVGPSTRRMIENLVGARVPA
ncbi:trypsin-like peptidase domain-containing protein [Streptomyces spinoverrucosus]|uniref:trypsin-like peptidase domain-containing protein n=1 Tax=Streptomyces spinoverrucosus TaxID=284043 RepID=UPI0018C4480B|nr:trypsin-like peptidase domain-containing protein [Streptomyces spinoverrucosus]MBG0852113.1 trypsin-like peptidase domain-containing protein [Streptomyces spinoverrucosus]